MTDLLDKIWVAVAVKIRVVEYFFNGPRVRVQEARDTQFIGREKNRILAHPLIPSEHVEQVEHTQAEGRLAIFGSASDANVEANAEAPFGVLSNQPSVRLSTADMGHQPSAAGFDNFSVRAHRELERAADCELA